MSVTPNLCCDETKNRKIYTHMTEIVRYFIFSHSKITTDCDCSHEIKRCLLLGRKAMTNLDSILKNKDITLPTKFCLVKAMFFSSSHVWVWELDLKEGWASKNWCFVTMVLEKTLESPLDCKEIKPVNPKGNQSWIFIGRTAAGAPILWPPNEKSQFTEKDWCWERLKAKREEGSRGWDG